jgi:hypothetical protein
MGLAAVSKLYGSRTNAVHALRGVTVDFGRGALTAVMGPSGSGKSTLLQCAAGLDRPTSGRVLLAGRDIGLLGERELTVARRRRIGFVFQAFNLVPALTAEQNVALPLRLSGRRPSRRDVAEALAQVGLADHGRRRGPGPAGLHRRRLRTELHGHGRRRGPLRQRRGLLVRHLRPPAGQQHQPGQLQERHGPPQLLEQLGPTPFGGGAPRRPSTEPSSRPSGAHHEVEPMQRIFVGAASRATKPVVVLLAALALLGGSYAAVQAAKPPPAPAPPAPVISSGPDDPTTETTATFAFSDAQAGVTFRCRLDGAAYAACTSPRSYTGLSTAEHSFQVQALDAAGHASPATSYTWTVQEPVGGLTLDGNLSTLLYPGASGALDVRISNPFSFDIHVSQLTVTVRRSTTRNGQPNPACDGTVNLTVLGQYSGPEPLRVPKKRTVSLSELGLPRSQWPQLLMPDLPVNQDACKRTTFTFDYAATATKVNR